MHPLLASTALGLVAAWPVAAFGLGLGRLVERLTDDPRPRAAVWSLAYALPTAALAATVALTFAPLSGAEPAPPAIDATAQTDAPAAVAAPAAWTPEGELIENLAWGLVGLSSAGLLARGLRWNRGRRRLAAIRTRAEPCQDAVLVEAVRVRAARLRVKTPRVRLSAEIAEPLLAGARRPVILLPKALAASKDAAQLELVCGHELAHLRRADNWRIPAEEALAGLFWLVPPVAALHDRMLAAREAVCDLVALRGAASEARFDYARVLVEALRTNALPAPQSAFTGRAGTLARMRLAAILQPGAGASAARLGLVVALGGGLTVATGFESLALASQARRIAPPAPPTVEKAWAETGAGLPVAPLAPVAEAKDAQPLRTMARPATDARPMAQAAAKSAVDAKPASGPAPTPQPNPKTNALQVISEMQASAPSRRQVVFLGDAAVTGRLDPVNVTLKINGAQTSPRFQPGDLRAGQIRRLEITDQRVAVDGKITVNVVMNDADS